jgi:hypothetical protein
VNGSDRPEKGFFNGIGSGLLFHGKWILRRASGAIFVIVCPQFVVGHGMRNFIKQHGW